MTIVIIEDEKDLGILMRNFLVKQLNTETPANIKLTTSLTEGLHCIKQMNPDWVFLDNNLPDGKGVEFISIAKKLSPSTKIIMITAFDTYSDRSKAYAEGADFFIGKPFTRDAINKTIEKLMPLS